MARTALLIVVSLALLLGLPLPARAAAASAGLDSAREAVGAPGAVVGVLRPGQAPLYAASGVINLTTGAAVTPDTPFAVGSLTKMFVAVVVLQLSAEGRLSLDDPLAKYLPQFPRADAITLRMLLQHNSGLGDPLREYMEASSGEHPTNSNPLVLAWLGLALAKHWTPQELVELVAADPPDALPGTRCAYSNGNYLLLGRVIQLVTGHEVAQEIRARILAPLGMSRTLLAGEEPLPPADIRCYMRRSGEYVDLRVLENASFAWTAGAMVSTAPDLLRFAQALFGGELLAPEQLAQMQSFIPMETWHCEYGLGLMRNGAGAEARLGHTGRTGGFSSSLWYYPATGEIVVALANLQTCSMGPLLDAAQGLAQ